MCPITGDTITPGRRKHIQQRCSDSNGLSNEKRWEEIFSRHQLDPWKVRKKSGKEKRKGRTKRSHQSLASVVLGSSSSSSYTSWCVFNAPWMASRGQTAAAAAADCRNVRPPDDDIRENKEKDFRVVFLVHRSPPLWWFLFPLAGPSIPLIDFWVCRLVMYRVSVDIFFVVVLLIHNSASNRNRSFFFQVCCRLVAIWISSHALDCICMIIINRSSSHVYANLLIIQWLYYATPSETQNIGG